MRKIVLTVTTVALLYAIVVGATPIRYPPHDFASLSEAQSGRQSKPVPIQVFVGTISKVGNQFVFSDDVNKNSYQLDDQETASKFEGKQVKVTGTLDATNNVIRVQSIEATA
jgi:hypothetical protein